MTRPVALLAALSLAACHTAESARRAELRRKLDEARVSRTPAEVWPDVQRFLNERGYPLVGTDREAIGQKGQGALSKLLSRGFETRVRDDGSRVLETDADRDRMRVRVEARPAPGGGSLLRVTMLKESELYPMEPTPSKDEDLELALLQRLDPAEAARVSGGAPPAAAGAVPAAPADPWAAVRFLAGSWAGPGPGGGEVRWTFAFTEGGTFLEVRGSPVLFAGPTARPGAREELGRISREPGGGLAWSQFTYGGQVDRWRSEPSDPGTLAFAAPAPESLPPGWRARLALRPEGADALVARLELAEPGKDLARAGEVRLSRAGSHASGNAAKLAAE